MANAPAECGGDRQKMRCTIVALRFSPLCSEAMAPCDERGEQRPSKARSMRPEGLGFYRSGGFYLAYCSSEEPCYRETVHQGSDDRGAGSGDNAGDCTRTQGAPPAKRQPAKRQPGMPEAASSKAFYALSPGRPCPPCPSE